MGAVTPEGKVKQEIRKRLDHPRIWYHMPVSAGMEGATLDFLCVIRWMDAPIFFTIEAKRPYIIGRGAGKVNARQGELMGDLALRMNVKCFVIDGSKGLAELDGWLLRMGITPESYQN